MPRMPEPDRTAGQDMLREETAEPSERERACSADDKMICERCGKAEMYRMHAVWRCPECGFKTDCCGW